MNLNLNQAFFGLCTATCTQLGDLQSLIYSNPESRLGPHLESIQDGGKAYPGQFHLEVL